MQEIDGALAALNMKPADCDFFAVVIGAGSFTGIRIGISCIKGLCFATGKPALAITSFDTLAYAEREQKLLCTVDAGHGYVYAAGYEEGKVSIPPMYCAKENLEKWLGEGYRLVDSSAADPAKGFLAAIRANAKNTCSAESLSALYLRKSSAEENLKN